MAAQHWTHLWQQWNAKSARHWKCGHSEKLYYWKVVLFAVCLKTSFEKAKIFLFSTVKHATLSRRISMFFVEEGVPCVLNSCQKFAIVKKSLNEIKPSLSWNKTKTMYLFPSLRLILDLFSSTPLLIFSIIGSPYYPELSFPVGSPLFLRRSFFRIYHLA